jgi:lipid II:glycine glycyltransferase (peptidoglycan interpeptide bridge formation enzyme)
MELQQSSPYKKYITQLHWTVLTLDGVNIFVKKIPFMGVIAKIQRPITLPYIPKLIPFLKKHQVSRIIVEPTMDTDQTIFHGYMHSLSKFFTIHAESFLPTKTIRVDLTVPEKMLFDTFTEAKRRAVRKAIKNLVGLQESHDIRDLIKIKSTSAGLFGGITTYGIDKLWKLLYPEHATILLAYSSSHLINSSSRSTYLSSRPPSRDLKMPDSSFAKASVDRQVRHDTIVGGVLLIFYDHIAYYWIAGATKKGKKLFAPTLLVWEALKVSKQRGCKQFDFVGVFDERAPKQFTSWKGFTKFKEGFGGKELYYPIN